MKIALVTASHFMPHHPSRRNPVFYTNTLSLCFQFSFSLLALSWYRVFLSFVVSLGAISTPLVDDTQSLVEVLILAYSSPFLTRAAEAGVMHFTAFFFFEIAYFQSDW